MKLSYTKNHVMITEFSPKEKHIAVNILTGNELKKGIQLPKTLWVLREILKYFPTLREDSELIREGRTLKAELENTINPSIKVVPGDKLRPYQRQDVERLKKMEVAGIFNEPRTGKTPTLITLMKELGTKRNLIVAPASLLWNWAKEFETWYPDITVYVNSESKIKRQKLYESILGKVGLASRFRPSENTSTFVLIMSKETLRLDMSVNDPLSILSRSTFDLAAVDEAHFLRNYKTTTSKAIFKIKSKHKYALTGTPTVKHAADIHGILHFLNPQKFRSYWAFVDRYFEQSTDWMGHKQIENVRPDREQELGELIALISTQRKRKDVMQWLPEKQRSTFPVQMDTKQQKLYADMAKYFMASDADTEIDTRNVITQLMRLRQLCLDPRLLGFDVPGAKTEALLEYLENHREPIVIMSMFTSYLKLLKPLIEKLGLKVGMIHGEMSNAEKDTSATLYQNGQYNVLLCNIISAGVGFTLDKGETVIFTDKAWNPIENGQAEDRICPTTEDKVHKHEIITFTCQGTVDARIDELLSQKISLTDYVNNGGARAIQRLLTGV